MTQQGYYFPIAILSIIWILISLFITYHWTETWFLTTAILGISLLEKALVVIESLAFAYYGFNTSLQLAVVAGFLVSLIASIWLLCSYIVVFRKTDSFKAGL
jgi:hypothetical protein